MQLSLRTLLAFEDNVFDVEQHRRLEQLLDPHAEATLGRMRSIVRNPGLGVPGLVDRQEELDPNYVAEYLDHQMPADVQSRFESYCLSADKYLAEIASIHHILSNVLGEPARTSRECRIQCYNVASTGHQAGVQTPGADMNNFFSSDSERPKHFRPFEPQQSTPVTPSSPVASLWNRLFPQKPAPTTQSAPLEKKSSLWTFTCIGLFVCALLLGWQQIEKQRDMQNLRNVTEPFVFVQNDIAPIDPTNVVEPPLLDVSAEPPAPLMPLEPIAQTSFTSELFPAPFAAPELPPLELTALEPLENTDENEATPPALNDAPETAAEPTVPEKDESASSAVANDSIIAFQPITAKHQADQLLAKGPTDHPVRPNARPAMPATAWQSQDAPVASITPAPGPPLPTSRIPYTQPITQTSGTGSVPRILGRVLPMNQPSVVFTAITSSQPWQLPPLPFDLNGEQYLLTSTPFRGTFELATGFRIEMIGDTKLCVLPLDASGTPGIFVDYGRIIIQPLQANQPLRIETEKSRGFVSSSGTNSVLFIDTFAEIADPSNSTKPAEEQKPKSSPILGFVPKNGERIIWKSISQPQPFVVESQGSVLLQVNQYRFGAIRTLPNWLGAMPMSPEDRMLAETCRQCFVDARGNGEQALTWLIQNESRSVRTLGLRLWGDLGRFDVPLTVMAEKRKEDDSVRQVLVHYFNEVMRRDEETIQRFADAIEIIKEAKRN